MYHLYSENSSPFPDSSKENQAFLFPVATPEAMQNPTNGKEQRNSLVGKSDYYQACPLQDSPLNSASLNTNKNSWEAMT